MFRVEKTDKSVMSVFADNAADSFEIFFEDRLHLRRNVSIKILNILQKLVKVVYHSISQYGVLIGKTFFRIFELCYIVEYRYIIRFIFYFYFIAESVVNILFADVRRLRRGKTHLRAGLFVAFYYSLYRRVANRVEVFVIQKTVSRAYLFQILIVPRYLSFVVAYDNGF